MPAIAIHASAVAVTSWPACVAITVRRASSRSARTPANRPNTVNGRKVASAITPTANAEWVSW